MTTVFRARRLGLGLAALCTLILVPGPPVGPQDHPVGVANAGRPPRPKRPPRDKKFHLVEATIADIHKALKRRELTCEGLVRLYLDRIKAYNGTCVNQPEGILGPVTTIPDAGQLNALATLNLRPATRVALGFDERKARSLTDPMDDDLSMPDALETAAELDRQFARTGKFVGPLHCVVMAIKDQYDTFDLRTTNGADAFYANDRPPDDSTFVKKLRGAGAIILAKANMGEYASGDRSAFGGVFCNPYDTERSPGRSSGGSGSSVAANLVTCAIGEESGPSVRNPTKNNNIVGLPAPVALVSRDGMFGPQLINDRVGPMCRTVEDVARLLSVIAGYDPKDPITVFGIGRLPSEPYENFAGERSLAGVRIGVVREYMDKSLFTVADFESIDIIDREIEVLRDLGASIVDPGPGGALFQDCIDQYLPYTRNALFIRQFPDLFPAGGDHIATLLDMYFDPSLVPGGPTLRGLGPASTSGGGKYFQNRYLRERGDANITSVADLIEKSNFFTDIRPGTGFSDKRAGLVNTNNALTLDLVNSLANQFALQQIVLQCMALHDLDAVTYPTGNVPAPKLGAPTEPDVNGRSALAWTVLTGLGFPAISVPAGFTAAVYDRVVEPSGGTALVGPIAAELPVGIDFLAGPFSEPVLIRIAGAYEAASKHRVPPPAFGPVPGEP